MSPDWLDYLQCQCFYQTGEPIAFDPVCDTVLLVRAIWPGVVEPSERLFYIQAHHLSGNSSFYRRLFSSRSVRSIPRTEAPFKHYKITLHSIDAEALFLILRACTTGRTTLPHAYLHDGFDRVCRIAETAYRLEFNIGAADPLDNTAPLTLAARRWLWELGQMLDAGNVINGWKLVKAAFYLRQRFEFRQYSAELATRLPDRVWLHLSGELQCRGRVCACEEHRLTREEEVITRKLISTFIYPLLQELQLTLLF